MYLGTTYFGPLILKIHNDDSVCIFDGEVIPYVLQGKMCIVCKANAEVYIAPWLDFCWFPIKRDSIFSARSLSFKRRFWNYASCSDVWLSCAYFQKFKFELRHGSAY